MKDFHEIFTKFKGEFPKICSDHEALGKEIHERSGPLTEKVRWLIKIGISGASQHLLALETHMPVTGMPGESGRSIRKTGVRKGLPAGAISLFPPS